MAIAKGVLELQPCQGEVNRIALVELAFARRSVALANGWYNGGTRRDRSQHGIRGPAQAVISG